MISISRHMDENDIAQEVRMERQVHNGAFLLLEGATDIARFTQFVDPQNCSIVNCYGRRKAIQAIGILTARQKIRGVLAAVDADFDRLTNKLIRHGSIIYSEFHDFDIDWARSEVVQRYLDQLKNSLDRGIPYRGDNLIEDILKVLKPVSTARFLNRAGTIRHKLSDIKIVEAFNGIIFDLDKYVALIAKARALNNSDSVKIKCMISASLNNDHNLYQLTNGHDFCDVLGLYLKDIGRKAPQTWGSEIALHLRLAFHDRDFLNTTISSEIYDWEDFNPPYRILDPRLKR